MKTSSVVIIAASLLALAGYYYVAQERSHQHQLELELQRQKQEFNKLKQEMNNKQQEQQVREAAIQQAQHVEQDKNVDAIKAKLTQLKRELRIRQDEAEQLEIALRGASDGNNAKADLNDANASLKTEQAVIDRLKKSIKNADNYRKNSAKQEKVTLQQNKSTYQQLNHDLGEQIKFHKNQITLLHKEIAALKKNRGRDANAQDQINVLQLNMTTETDALQGLTQQQADLKYQYEQQRSTASAQNQQTDSREDLKQQLAAEEIKLKELNELQKTQKQEYSTESSHFDKLRNDFKIKQQAIRTLREEIGNNEKLLKK